MDLVSGKRTEPAQDLLKKLSGRVIGQGECLEAIVPYLLQYEAGMAPEGRPAGVFLLLGPTGTGKTRTVEALAEVLHGSPRNVLKIDCGEYQLDHETAKLIGAPPGYLGHRETAPLLTQARLSACTSSRHDLSMVLFDEVEKASPSLTRLLLGVLDKGTLRLGDNSTVSFERSMIFFTSNLGAREMMKASAPGFGFASAHGGPPVAQPLDQIALRAARRRFAPEFMNRVDAVLTYRPLETDALEGILNLELQSLQEHIRTRLGSRAFHVNVPNEPENSYCSAGRTLTTGRANCVV